MQVPTANLGSICSLFISVADYYYRARYYDPSAGRFISEDPVRFAGEDADFYRYVWNGSVAYRDPRGLDGTTGVIDAPVAVTSGAAAAGAAAGTAATGGAVAGGTATPTFSLIAGGSAAGGATGTALVTGGLVGVIIITGAYDGYQLNKLGQAYGLWGPSSLSNQRQREYQRYKDFCNSPVPGTGDRCSDLSKQIDHALKCIQLIESFDARWNPGRHSDNSIQEFKNRAERLKKAYDSECTGKGKC